MILRRAQVLVSALRALLFPLCFLLAPSVASADGPPLAHLTLEGRTIVLTGEGAPDLSAPDGIVSLQFAQRHLGFPMPPVLTVSLTADGDTWALHDLTLHRTSDMPPTVFGSDGLRITGISGTGPDLRLTIEGDALMPGGTLTPVQIDLSLRSP